MERTTAEKVIRALSLVATLAVAWQAVRYVMGDIGNVTLPVFELFEHALGSDKKDSARTAGLWPLQDLFDLISGLVVGLMGFVVWLIAAAVVGSLGDVAGRVAAVGWKQYQMEQSEARETARIAAERQAAKDRRRELRRKVIEARQPSRGSSGILPFVLGVLFGSFFL